MKKSSLRGLLREVHEDEQGALSLETILIIGAIALPILIFLIKFGWPRIKEFFLQGLEDLEEGAVEGAGTGTGTGTY
ncbi:MAG: hypothetical protein HQ582_17265 [Planctomycetes bacterium]|nr:hypothetical protein [Planctomycetota bacterium]